jgi:hypothetical protein
MFLGPGKDMGETEKHQLHKLRQMEGEDQESLGYQS